jgi:hypothetical protein
VANYTKGLKKEYQSRLLLEAAGYEVMRSAGSRGLWDLVGISGTGIVLCQVKVGDWPGTLELEAMRKFPVPENCVKIIHRWRRGQQTPDVRRIS